jgi:hypothetical protein
MFWWENLTEKTLKYRGRCDYYLITLRFGLYHRASELYSWCV